MVLRQSRSTPYWCVALIVGALLLAFGPGWQQKGDGQFMSSSQTAQKDNCKLVVESRIEAQNVLHVRYTFHNDTGHDVYLFNRLYKEIDEGAVFDTEPNLVNVEILQRGILLSKKIIAVPPDVDVEKPSLPCSSLVKSGGKVSEAFELPLPLSEWTPYLGLTGQPPSAEIVRRRAWFEVGYFVSSQASQLLVQSVKTKQGDAFYIDPFPIIGQKTLEVELPLEIPIRIQPRR